MMIVGKSNNILEREKESEMGFELSLMEITSIGHIIIHEYVVKNFVTENQKINILLYLYVF